MAEVTSKFKVSCLKRGEWNTMVSYAMGTIDGLKIQASNSAYYLQYRTWNEGKTAFYPYVKSNIDDYAGVSGRPIQLFQIQAVRADGTNLTSGVVVMYRAYVEGKWLPWVSNADPQFMQSVQKKYGLEGTLDASGAYAGISGKNIGGMEIRVFEEGSIGDYVGGEISGGFSYMTGGAWKSFTASAVAPSIEGLKLQTSAGKGYYLSYKTWNEGQANYYPAVKSTVNDYAGAPGKPIQRLAVSVYKNDGAVLTSGVIVMYRAFVEGSWLPWVSNAAPEWMRAVKEKHRLDGTLDTASGHAGVTGKNISGVEIRIFEEDAPNAGNDRFEGEEIPLSMSYMAENSQWQSFTKAAAASRMDGLKLRTSSQDFYLSYKTWNSGNSYYYPEVKSTEDDYAGMAGKPIQRVSINACKPDGTRMTSGVAVMYRVLVNGKWLPWVSNADPEIMQNVQSRYNLGGTLDTRSGYAGIDGSSIGGVEIRVFKGELDAPIQNLPGEESAPALSYMKAGSWSSFSGSVLTDGIQGVKIQTAPGKPYYLTYKTWNSGKDYYYPEVKSTEDDYAGMAGRPIQLLNIKAFQNDGTALASGVVVMYRVFVEGKWMAWASNASEEWMRSAQNKYHLGGTLDSAAAYAGIRGKDIGGVEIRVFEEKEIVDTPITPTGKYKILQVPFIPQNPKYPTGCESVTAVMALNYAGINYSVDTFIDTFLEKSSSVGFNPNETFGGDPRSASGFGCYAPVIKKALDKALVNRRYSAKELKGAALSKLCSDYIDQGTPVILWATMGMNPPRLGRVWYSGETRIEWIVPEHCLLLVGYDEKHYIFNDPQKSALTYYTKESVEAAYKGLFQQAVVIVRKEETEEPVEPEKPEVPIFKYGAVKNPVTGEIYPIQFQRGLAIDHHYQLENSLDEAKPTRLTKANFNWLTFFMGLEFDDSLLGGKHPGLSSTLGVFAGCLSAASLSIERVYIDVNYYKYPPTGEKRAQVLCGSSNNDSFYKMWILYGQKRSLKEFEFFNINNENLDKAAWLASIDKTGREQFEAYTGESHQFGYSYDYDILLAPEREINKYSSEIFMGTDGKMYEAPIWYEGEKIELVVRSNFVEIARIDVSSEVRDRIYEVSDDRVSLFSIMKTA